MSQRREVSFKPRPSCSEILDRHLPASATGPSADFRAEQPPPPLNLDVFFVEKPAAHPLESSFSAWCRICSFLRNFPGKVENFRGKYRRVKNVSLFSKPLPWNLVSPERPCIPYERGESLSRGSGRKSTAALDCQTITFGADSLKLSTPSGADQRKRGRG
jgi:hypothetical protein